MILARRVKLGVGEWVLLAIAAGTVVSQALVPRDLSRGEALMLSSVDGDYAGYTVSRVVTGIVLVVSSVTIAAALTRRRLSRSAFGLLTAYLAWFGGNYVLNAVGRDTPDTWVRVFHQPLVAAALLLAAPLELPRAVRIAKLALLGFVYAAVIGAIVVPDMAVAQSYESVIPGFDIRLYGIGGGATSLASCTLMYVLLELSEPTAGKLRFLHLAAAGGVLVATQSKTAWAFAALMGLLAAVAFAEKRLLGLRRVYAFGPVQWTSLAVAIVAYAIFAESNVGALDFARTEANVSTLTGRTWIWQASIEVFLDNPWFGYGPKLWADADFFSRYGHYMHSHNQMLQALAGAGVVGLLGFLVYVLALVARVMKAVRVTLAPALLLAWMLFQGLTDVPLRSDFVLDQFFLAHVVLLLVAAAAGTAVASTPPRGVRPVQVPPGRIAMVPQRSPAAAP